MSDVQGTMDEQRLRVLLDEAAGEVGPAPLKAIRAGAVRRRRRHARLLVGVTVLVLGGTAVGVGLQDESRPALTASGESADRQAPPAASPSSAPEPQTAALAGDAAQDDEPGYASSARRARRANDLAGGWTLDVPDRRDSRYDLALVLTPTGADRMYLGVAGDCGTHTGTVTLDASGTGVELTLEGAERPDAQPGCGTWLRAQLSATTSLDGDPSSGELVLRDAGGSPRLLARPRS